MTEVLEIHTSDRDTYRRCRRKWDFTSPLRRNLEPDPPTDMVNPWLGTGIHFSLQDYHGYNRFGDPVLALEAYYNAFRPSERPAGADEAIELGLGMLEYYKFWLEVPGRPKYETVWLEGVPQVEIEWRLSLTELVPEFHVAVVYHGTFDRIVRDSHGGLWVEDYKTTRVMDFNRLALDPQMKAYSWAAEQVYQWPFEGALMLQMVKDIARPPKPLKTGGFSQNKRQKTTHWLYRQTLMDHYGKIPSSYIDFLNALAMEETAEGDRFIHLGKIEHNSFVKRNTYNQILQQVREMLNPDTPLYPNPTMSCSWDCPFRTVCILMDEGGDWEEMLETNYRKKGGNKAWMSKIKWPDQPEKPSLEAELEL